MGQLGGIALRLGGDGLHAQFIDGTGGEGGEHDPEAQRPEERGPIGVVLIQVQHPRDTDDTAGGLLRREGGIVKQPLPLIGHEIGARFRRRSILHPLFAAVAGDVPPAVGESADGQQAVIFAAAASGGLCGESQGGNSVKIQRGGGLAAVAVTGDQRRSERTHQPGDIRTHRVHTGDALESAQYRLVIEGAALHHDVLAQLAGVGQLDDLEQGVFDDGVGKAGRDIRYRRALLLGLLHVGVHEHGAAGAQIHRMLREQGLVSKLRRRKAQRIGKIL